MLEKRLLEECRKDPRRRFVAGTLMHDGANIMGDHVIFHSEVQREMNHLSVSDDLQYVALFSSETQVIMGHFERASRPHLRPVDPGSLIQDHD